MLPEHAYTSLLEHIGHTFAVARGKAAASLGGSTKRLCARLLGENAKQGERDEIISWISASVGKKPAGHNSNQYCDMNTRKIWTFCWCIVLCSPPGDAQTFHVHANMGVTFENIRDIKGDYQHTYHLKLVAQNLREVPKEVREMPNLYTLLLSDNKITRLGDALANATQLQVLDLDNNDLREIPLAALTACSQLEELHIRGNNIKYLPTNFGNLKYLKILDIGENNVSNSDTTIYLPYLLKLRADANQLESIPTFLNQCKSLEYLNLNQNRIHDLSGIDQLNRLRTLNIGDNPLTSIEPIAELGNLEHLTLDWIDLDTINQAGLERLKSLRILSIENCNLHQLPAWVGARNNLEELSLIGNNLTEIPPALYQMKRLKKLWLGKNPLPQEQVDHLRRKLSRCEVNF